MYFTQLLPHNDYRLEDKILDNLFKDVISYWAWFSAACSKKNNNNKKKNGKALSRMSSECLVYRQTSAMAIQSQHKRHTALKLQSC